MSMNSAEITNEELLDDLRRIAAVCPELTMQKYNWYGKYGDLILRLRFGRFKNALRAAGLISEPPLKQLKEISSWSEEYCLDFLRKVRWPDGVRCPRCDDGSAIKRLVNQVHSNKALYTYACTDCNYHFTDFTGSFLHKRSVRMRDWLRVIFLFKHQAHGDLDEQARILGIERSAYKARVNVISSSRLAGELGKRLMEELT